METYSGSINLDREIITYNNQDLPFNMVKIVNVEENPQRNYKKGFKYGLFFGIGVAIFSMLVGYTFYYNINEFLLIIISYSIIYGCIGAFIGLFFKKKPIDLTLTVTNINGDIIKIKTNKDLYEKMQSIIFQSEEKRKQEKQSLQDVHNIVQNEEQSKIEQSSISNNNLKNNKEDSLAKNELTLNYVNKLKELKDLFDNKIIDESEYKSLKEKVLEKYRQLL